MKTIPLSQGKEAVVDDEDYERLAQFKWCALKQGNTFYARRNVHTPAGWTLASMHRMILKPPNNMQCDHIDGNGLNNQRANLRACTRAENTCNQRPQVGCASRFKGVAWHKAAQKWQAQIQNVGKQMHLGYFTDEVDAARAYDAAARELFGEFARPNFPEEVVIE